MRRIRILQGVKTYPTRERQCRRSGTIASPRASEKEPVEPGEIFRGADSYQKLDLERYVSGSIDSPDLAPCMCLRQPPFGLDELASPEVGRWGAGELHLYRDTIQLMSRSAESIQLSALTMEADPTRPARSLSAVLRRLRVYDISCYDICMIIVAATAFRLALSPALLSLNAEEKRRWWA
jgi:hypothetical protein